MTAEAPNPERRSNGAVLCVAAGVIILGACYFLGLGAALSLAWNGETGFNLAALGPALAVVAFAIAGVLLTLGGGIWMLVQVIADATQANATERYKDVER
jgi:hypothetical protein